MKLQYRIILFIFIILLVVGVTGAGVMLYLQRQTATRQFEELALVLASAVYGDLEQHMIEGNPSHIQETVERIALGAFITEAVIISGSQRIYASANTSEIGETKSDDADLGSVLASGIPAIGTRQQNGVGESLVTVPIVNRPDCYDCHGAEPEILGAIQIGLDRTPLGDQIGEQTLIMILIGGLTFVGVGWTLYLMLKSEVLNPLQHLAASARTIAKGDFSARVGIVGKGETKVLAETFNEMAERVEQHTHALEDAKSELEQRVQERTRQVQQIALVRGQLLERLVGAQEEERQRVARELHDEAGQALTQIMMNLARTRDALPGDATEVRDRLSQSRSLAEQALAEIRRLIYELRPEVLDQLGLVPALRSYVKSRLEAASMSVRLRFRGLDDQLSPQVEITLFRVIQEAITNILRHSGASTVNIEMAGEKSEIIVTIEDDGRGFDVEAVFEDSESWGLRGMRERVASLGGELSIQSEVGHGTRLQVRISVGKE